MNKKHKCKKEVVEDWSTRKYKNTIVSPYYVSKIEKAAKKETAKANEAFVIIGNAGNEYTDGYDWIANDEVFRNRKEATKKLRKYKNIEEKILKASNCKMDSEGQFERLTVLTAAANKLDKTCQRQSVGNTYEIKKLKLV